MTDAVSITKIQIEQDGLQAEFEQAQKILQDATVEYKEIKTRLVKFNNKYGRVLQMMKED